MVHPLFIAQNRKIGVVSPVEEIVYGFLYNWYAVDDTRGLAASGWSVPSDAQWTALTDYIGTNYNVSPNDFGVGNHLKSCRQVNSPLGGECATTEHPRWEEHGTEYGRDSVGFNALPGGYRNFNGNFNLIGYRGYWWSSTESDTSIAWSRNMSYNDSNVGRVSFSKEVGFSVRLTRPATATEKTTKSDGDACDNYVGNDGKVYQTVYIGENDTDNAMVWLVDNLAETKYSNGDWIQGFDGGTYTIISDGDWNNLTTGALCAYDDDLTKV